MLLYSYAVIFDCAFLLEYNMQLQGAIFQPVLFTATVILLLNILKISFIVLQLELSKICLTMFLILNLQYLKQCNTLLQKSAGDIPAKFKSKETVPKMNFLDSLIRYKADNVWFTQLQQFTAGAFSVHTEIVPVKHTFKGGVLCVHKKMQ